MHAEKLTLKTDTQGHLASLPALPPETAIELILLFPEVKNAGRICCGPPSELKGRLKVLGDIK
ncbi:MAG: hypothetical protein GY862_26220 [Gammaproteobacteria bacterium]|nr:hypothetical protein [Gammaproteobacteria bacterium]